MAVMCDWYSRATSIIGMSYIGNWTIQECDAANLTLGKLIQPVTERCDVIVNLTEAAYTLPIGILWHWKQQMAFNDAMFSNWGINVYVTQNEVYQAYIEEGMATSNAVRKHCRLAKNIEDAMQLIQQERQNSKV